MKIGIIVHSQTGNTHSVALRLKGELIEKGHEVFLERLIHNPKNPKMVIDEVVDIQDFDALIIGAYVEGFDLSKYMKLYLDKLDLNKKKVACFVTEFFPFKWMGGNRAIKKMTEMIKEREGEVIKTGIINWSSRNREKMINDLIEQFNQVFS